MCIFVPVPTVCSSSVAVHPPSQTDNSGGGGLEIKLGDGGQVRREYKLPGQDICLSCIHVCTHSKSNKPPCVLMGVCS